MFKGKKINNGSFAKVYEDEEDTNYVFKKCKFENNNIPNLLEPIIMSSLDYEYINKGVCYTDNDFLYIRQKKAKRDLQTNINEFCKKDIKRLKKIAYKIILAIKFLHDNSIIHCDIKLDNILYYGKSDIKLTDFSLTILDGTYNHNVCTITHKAPEILFGLDWGKKIDIWALGCTLYHLFTGELIFLQSKGKHEHVKYINSILDWGFDCPIKQYEDPIFFNSKCTYYSEKYNKPVFKFDVK